MRIGRRDLSLFRSRGLGAAVARMAEGRLPAGRVCGESCAFRCEQCGSTRCNCECSQHCPRAAHALSEDPDRHPIEPGIQPLVFAMKRLGVFTPCWSCEGHLRADGGLSKLPRVWFYCDRTVHLRLLATALNQLKQAGRLGASWQVTVTYSDPDNPDTTFCLEPTPEGAPSLPALQADVRAIAHALQGAMTDGARRLQQAL